MTDTFQLPDVTSANCSVQEPGTQAYTITSECRDMLRVQQDKAAGVVDLIDSTTFDFTNVGGLELSTTPISYSVSVVEIGKSVPTITDRGAGGTGATGGGTSGTLASTPTPLVQVPSASGGSTADSRDPAARHPRNPLARLVVAPGVTVLNSKAAQEVDDRLAIRPVSSRLATAPRVPASRFHPIALVVSGVRPSAVHRVLLKIDGKYLPLGEVMADSMGKAGLPVFRVATAGTYTVAIIDTQTDTTRYLRLRVSDVGN